MLPFRCVLPNCIRSIFSTIKLYHHLTSFFLNTWRVFNPSNIIIIYFCFYVLVIIFSGLSWFIIREFHSLYYYTYLLTLQHFHKMCMKEQIYLHFVNRQSLAQFMFRDVAASFIGASFRSK